MWKKNGKTNKKYGYIGFFLFFSIHCAEYKNKHNDDDNDTAKKQKNSLNVLKTKNKIFYIRNDMA